MRTEDVLAVHAVALRDGEQAHGAEGALRVNVQALSLATLHVDRKLRRVSSRQPARAAHREQQGRTWHVTASWWQI